MIIQRYTTRVKEAAGAGAKSRDMEGTNITGVEGIHYFFNTIIVHQRTEAWKDLTKKQKEDLLVTKE